MQTVPPSGATNTRYVVLVLTVSMSVLLYLDRVCISVAGDYIREDLGISKSALGFVFSAFFLTYAVAQVPVGWLGDRLGARKMLVGCVLAWSLLTGLTAFASSLGLLLLVRMLFGIAQAGAYPIAARVNSLWMPFQQRALGSACVALGGRVGGAVAPALTVSLIALVGSWQSVFLLYAAPGLLWALIFWFWFRDRPGDHPGCNAAEVALISYQPSAATSPHGKATGVPWVEACRSLSLWMQCLAQFTTNVAWVFLITWLPTYLRDVHQATDDQVGLLSSLPLTAGIAGCFLGGAATDWLTRHIGLRWGRALLGSSTKFLAAIWAVIALSADDPIVAVIAFSMMSFSVDLGLGATWAYFQDAGGPYVGTLLGWANMFGNFGAVVGPILLIELQSQYNWTLALAACAAFLLASGVCWLWIDARVPIVSASRAT